MVSQVDNRNPHHTIEVAIHVADRCFQFLPKQLSFGFRSGRLGEGGAGY
jgi:hypothetical protein